MPINDDVKNLGVFFEQAEQFLTTVRLLKGGDVGILGEFHQSLPGKGFVLNPLYREELFKAVGTSCIELDKGDGAALQAEFECVGRVKGKIDVAIRRFNQAFHKRNWDDRLLDMVIALEHCLLERDGALLGYKFKMRGAALLSRADANRNAESDADRLKAVYDKRSKVVHEGKSLPKPEVQDDFSFGKQVLRAMIGPLQGGGSREAIQKGLDTLMLGSSGKV